MFPYTGSALDSWKGKWQAVSLQAANWELTWKDLQKWQSACGRKKYILQCWKMY